MNIKIEKRIPFGFKGFWGKCYKQTNYNASENAITYQRTTYFDIGYDVQFKLLESGVDKSIMNSQPIANLIARGDYMVIKTTDAYIDESNTYKCICQPNDIILFDNQYWVIEKIDVRSVYTPQKQAFYYLTIKNVFEEILTKTVLDNISIIKDFAFAGQMDLTSITIPNSVTTIGSLAFAGCTGLTEIKFPKSIQEIGSYAFRNCTGLKKVVFEGQIDALNLGTFSNCSNIELYDFSKCSSVIKIPGLINLTIGHKTGCIIKVPANSYNDWITANFWRDLTDVVWISDEE